MAFISSAQKTLLGARLIAGVPSVNTADALKIAAIICDWLEQDAIPQLIVPAGIAGFGGIPGPTVTIAPGTVK